MVLHTPATRTQGDTSHFFQIEVDSRAHGAGKHFQKVQGNGAKTSPGYHWWQRELSEGQQALQGSLGVILVTQSLHCSTYWKLYQALHPLSSVSLESH